MTLPPVPPDRARRLIAAFAGVRALVIGDVMLDRFLVGRVTRISPEAPVPVVAFEHETLRIGGAGNVAEDFVDHGPWAMSTDGQVPAVSAECYHNWLR